MKPPEMLLVFPAGRCTVPQVAQDFEGYRWAVVAVLDRADYGGKLAQELARPDETVHEAELAPGMTAYVVGGSRTKV